MVIVPIKKSFGKLDCHFSNDGGEYETGGNQPWTADINDCCAGQQVDQQVHADVDKVVRQPRVNHSTQEEIGEDPQRCELFSVSDIEEIGSKRQTGKDPVKGHFFFSGSFFFGFALSFWSFLACCFWGRFGDNAMTTSFFGKYSTKRID